MKTILLAIDKLIGCKTDFNGVANTFVAHRFFELDRVQDWNAQPTTHYVVVNLMINTNWKRELS